MSLSWVEAQAAGPVAYLRALNAVLRVLGVELRGQEVHQRAVPRALPYLDPGDDLIGQDSHCPLVLPSASSCPRLVLFRLECSSPCQDCFSTCSCCGQPSSYC